MKAHAMCWICAFALSASLLAAALAGQAPEPGTRTGDHTSRQPIRIDGDQGFTTANGVTGGDGTAGNPWAIEGWDISGQGSGYCIYIGNTTEHFVIRDCRLHDARGNSAMYYSTESGVILYNVINGVVAGNRVYSNDFDGIYLQNSSHVRVSGNEFSGNRWGVMLMAGSNNNTIRNNVVNSSTDYGIGVIDSPWNRVEGNNVTGNANMGIFLGDSARNVITGNNVSGNDEGIVLEGSDGNTVSENNVTSNTEMGLRLWASSGNRLYHNNIMGNGKQARDESGANSWDNGFPSGGNHWSDYSGIDANRDGMGDSAYTLIEGGMGARDRYPFMKPWFRDTESPVAVAGPDQAVDEGTVVRFNGSASTDNVGVAVYTWAFEYGSGQKVLDGPTPAHNFTLPGVFAVTLEARDSAGNRGADTITVTVNDITPPVANAGPDIQTPEGAAVELNGSASYDNLAVTGFVWGFNDGMADVVLMGPVTTHTFSVAGAYTVTLNVTDAAGHWDTDTAIVTVLPDTVPPVTDAGQDINATVGETVLFNGSASTDNVGIVNYTWSLEHNGTAVSLYGPVADFVFWVPGNYTVTLTVGDAAGNTGTASITVRVSDSEIVTPDGSGDGAGETGSHDSMASHMRMALLGVACAGAAALLLLRPGKSRVGSEKKPEVVGRLDDGQSQYDDEQ